MSGFKGFMHNRLSQSASYTFSLATASKWLFVRSSTKQPRSIYSREKVCVFLPVISFAYLLEMESVFLRSG